MSILCRMHTLPFHAESRIALILRACDAIVKTLTINLRGLLCYHTRQMRIAVTPGSFVLPGATVEDMYRPELRGLPDAGQSEGSAVGP